jgi:predicted PurR-regulated permease PerM
VIGPALHSSRRTAVPFEQSLHDKDYLNRAVEVSIHVGLGVLLVWACFLILRPFLPPVIWGIVIAIALYPWYRKLATFLGERRTLAAVLCTVVLLAILIVPIYLLTGTLVEGVQTLTARLKEGTLNVPPPPPGVAGWPIIGGSLNRVWLLASNNLNDLLSSFAPQIRAAVSGLLSASAGVAFTVLQFILSIVVGGVLLASAEGTGKAIRLLANRLFGERGPEFHKLIGATIRSVTVGILGVAFIQTVLAGIGFVVEGLPSAGLWAMIFLFAAVLQVGILVLIPAVIYAFTITSTSKAVIFLIWCAIVGLMDNVLKPVLLGRGVEVPILVVFLGAIGGFIAMGLIGLFVGAIVLSVGYKLFLAWLNRPVATTE